MPSSDDNVTINAHITDSDSDLAAATLYVGDGSTHDVLWAQRMIFEVLADDSTGNRVRIFRNVTAN